MPVESFTREQFEAALPRNKRSGDPLCKPLGVQDKEYAYMLPIIGRQHVGILIRSSVDSSGVSAGCGEDSIRAYIVDPTTQKPLAKKLTRWTTRQRGWESRLTNLLQRLYKTALRIKDCEKCKIPMRLRVSKTEKNPDRPFLSCPNCDAFEWLKER